MGLMGHLEGDPDYRDSSEDTDPDPSDILVGLNAEPLNFSRMFAQGNDSDDTSSSSSGTDSDREATAPVHKVRSALPIVSEVSHY